MKKTMRIGAIMKILTDAPNKNFSLKYFCDLFDAAKSSISEDLKNVSEICKAMELGSIETTPGAGGGVKFVPYISDEKCASFRKSCAIGCAIRAAYSAADFSTPPILCSTRIL